VAETEEGYSGSRMRYPRSTDTVVSQRTFVGLLPNIVTAPSELVVNELSLPAWGWKQPERIWQGWGIIDSAIGITEMRADDGKFSKGKNSRSLHCGPLRRWPIQSGRSFATILSVIASETTSWGKRHTYFPEHDSSGV
jgi:hypothetical protein